MRELVSPYVNYLLHGYFVPPPILWCERSYSCLEVQPQLFIFSVDDPYSAQVPGEWGTRLIRAIDDIEKLKKGEYGLPSISTFLLVVIKPNILLHMALKKNHDTTTSNRINDIIADIKVPPNEEVKMIRSQSKL